MNVRAAISIPLRGRECAGSGRTATIPTVRPRTMRTATDGAEAYRLFDAREGGALKMVMTA
jgi:hypothetical protein